MFAALAARKSPYPLWDYSDPELAAAGTLLHGFEFVFVRLAPAALLAAVIGIVLTGRKKHKTTNGVTRAGHAVDFCSIYFTI